MTAPTNDPPVTRRSWTDVIGLHGRPKAVQILTAVIVGAAFLIALTGALLPVPLPAGRPFPAVAGVVVATALAAGAQLARLRFRLGRGVVSVAWGEAAFIIGFVLAPPGWLPLATLVGAGAAWAVLSFLTERRAAADILHLVGSLALGSAGAALVTSLIAGDAGATSVRMQCALAAGAAVYLAITFGLAVVTLRLHRDADTRQILARVPYAKIPIFVGNVIIGLGAVFAVAHQPVWLLAFVPFLWLLQRSYRFHLRAEEERRLWEAFAEATAALPGGSIGEVAAAGLRGALTVFGAMRAELEVRGETGPIQYAEDGPGLENPPAGLPGPAITRTMAVAGEVIGELTVWLSEPTLPVPRDEAAISAYGDALAGALHDAAAHERVIELEERVAYETVHDVLTGLMNRNTLVSEGDRVARALARETPIALVLLDVNDFREVNGTLGHRCGDEVLQLVAERLTGLAAEGELVARIGDDDFALLVTDLPELSNPAALRRAREIVEELARPMEIAGVRLAVEVAVGVAVVPTGQADLVELMRRASLALDQAKAEELAVAVYDSGQDAMTTDGLALLAELRDALAVDDQIVLNFQPAVDLITTAPTGVEALIRWRHPRRGQLSPGDFIRTVEHTELLAPFTRRVLDLALSAAVEWTAAGIDLPVSVNVAARSLLDPTFPGQVADALHRHRLDASSLVLEITESVAVSEQDIVDDVLGELRDSGVQLSLDDFGTGYSSLAIVTRVPVDEIKIDRSFVDDMIDLPAAEAVVRGAVELGARLRVRIVAEGVETTEQRAALMALNCPTAQGYHFCKPMPPDRIVETLLRLHDSAADAEIVPLRADDAS